MTLTLAQLQERIAADPDCQIIVIDEGRLMVYTREMGIKVLVARPKERKKEEGYR
jgi:hypothetical protein